jgi:hypothetical protein
MDVLQHGAGSLQVAPWAALDRGDVVLGAGVREVDRRDDPVGLEPHGTSVALVLERDGREEWWLLAEQLGATSAISVPEGDRFVTFDRWVDVQVAAARGEQPGPVVTFADDGRLVVAAPTATLLAQRSGTDLGPAFAGERTAVAKVQHEGVVWYVLAREVDGVPDYLPTISDATTIDEYLAEARRWLGVVGATHVTGL